MSDHRNRVRFVDHWTTHTGSDHRALFVHVQVRKRRGKWTDLLLVSVNMGGKFKRADMSNVFVDAVLSHMPFVIACQEAGDQDWLGEWADACNVTYLAGVGKGASSTPLIVWRTLDVRQSRSLLILGRRLIGKGAGPDRNKAKWLNKNRMVLDGVRFGVSSWHQVASQQNRPRMVAAIAQAAAMIRALAVRRPMFVVGDVNSDQDQPLSRWLRRRGMTSNHDALGEIPTHGNRSIDAALVASKWVAR